MAENLNDKIITIDGPGGSGKGTIAIRLANYLGWNYLDSGSHFRALAYVALQNKVDYADVPSLLKFLGELRLTSEFTNENEVSFKLNGKDVSAEIRHESCSAMASKIAIHGEVRQLIVKLQGDFLAEPGLVTDGRDMGTIVFPGAKFKIYLHASSVIAANRRHNQLKKSGIDVSLEEVLSEMKQRDMRDLSRKVAPLKVAPDAYFLDTDDLSIDQVFQKALMFIERDGKF